MLYYDILLQRSELKVFACVPERSIGMCPAVELTSGSLDVLMPVIEEQIVKECAPCACPRIKSPLPAQKDIVVGHIHAVLEKGCMSVVMVLLHGLHYF